MPWAANAQSLLTIGNEEWSTALEFTTDCSPISVTSEAYTYGFEEDEASKWNCRNVDDVKVRVISACEDVDNVVASDITNHSAKLSWTAAEGQTAWEIAYKADANFNPNVHKASTSRRSCTVSTTMWSS